MEKKEILVTSLARFQAHIFKQQWRKIGSLYRTEDAGFAKQFQQAGAQFPEACSVASLDSGDYELGSRKDHDSFFVRQMVSTFFFWGHRGSRAVNRGPFDHSHGWLATRIKPIIDDQTAIAETSDDEDAMEDAQIARELALGLEQRLPRLFPVEETEKAMLCHDDLHQSNMLVDNDDILTAILDWECASTLLLWKACQLPDLLLGRSRDERPLRESYSAYDPEIEREDPEQL